MKTLLALLFISSQAFAEVWQSHNQWSSVWESAYSAWVETSWTNDIFVKPGSLLLGIKSDCAEATYAMRATFSYLNKLEFLAHQYRSEEIVSNHLKIFDNETNPDKRFRKFLGFLFERVNSTTLALDTYPIHMDRMHFVPGTIYVAPGDHSFQIIGLSDSGLPLTLNSTTPADARLLSEVSGFPFYVPKDFIRFLDGYRAFREPNELATPIIKMKQASLEQFEDSKVAQKNYFKFTELTLKRLGTRSESSQETAERNMKNLCFYAMERSPRVIKAANLWMDANKKCLSPPQFYSFSTFDRDVQLKDYFLAVRAMSESPNFKTVSENLRAEIEEIFSDSQTVMQNSLVDLNPKRVEKNTSCVIELGIPQKPKITLRELWQLVSADMLVADPNATILQRWGLEPFTKACD